MNCVVYWLYDASCVCFWRHGYIGVSGVLRNRLKQHHAQMQRKFSVKVLYSGAVEECFALENRLRPHPFIGWNKSEGGAGGSRAPRSNDTRQKMRDAALQRYADPVERAKMSDAQKGRAVTWGAKIAAGRRGKKLSDATRAKMSAVRKGKLRSPFTPEHCAKIAAAKRGMKMPWVAEANRQRARKQTEALP